MAATLNENLQALYALQQIDTQIARARRTQTQLDNGAQATKDAQDAQAHATAQVVALHKISTDLKDSELKLAALETKRKAAHQRMYQGSITNAKELANIEREIESLGRQQSEMDTRILEYMEQVETAQTTASTAQAAAREADTKRADTLAKFQSRFEALSLEMADATRRRPAAVAEVEDPALLKRYEDIRAKHAGIGIAKIEDGNCGGCHMKLPSADVKVVREGVKPQTCENCGRLLTL